MANQNGIGQNGIGSTGMTGADDLGTKAKEAADRLKEKGKEVLSDTRDAIGSTVSDLTSEAAARVDDARQKLANQGERVADSLREASYNADADTLQAKVLDSVASGISSVSTTLRETDASRVMASVQGFARRNPILFATGAAVAGLVVARMLAGSMRSSGDDGSDVYGSQYGRKQSDNSPAGMSPAKPKRSTGSQTYRSGAAPDQA